MSDLCKTCGNSADDRCVVNGGIGCPGELRLLAEDIIRMDDVYDLDAALLASSRVCTMRGRMETQQDFEAKHEERRLKAFMEALKERHPEHPR